MAEKEDKKGLFGKAVDKLTGRDEKETISELKSELEQAKKEAEAAKKAVRSMMDHKIESGSEKGTLKKETQAAEKKIAELESKLEDLMEKDRQRLMEERKKDLEERKARIEESQKPDIIATHTVESGETLSHIALKYYKHATPPYWRLLLEHNKEVLKGNERNLQTGMTLQIPELPEALQD